jgi:hypothetical protein
MHLMGSGGLQGGMSINKRGNMSLWMPGPLVTMSRRRYNTRAGFCGHEVCGSIVEKSHHCRHMSVFPISILPLPPSLHLDNSMANACAPHPSSHAPTHPPVQLLVHVLWDLVEGHVAGALVHDLTVVRQGGEGGRRGGLSQVQYMCSTASRDT